MEDERCVCYCICGPQSEPCGLSSGFLALRELGAQVRGQGSQSYWRGSVSHVNQLVENTYNNRTINFSSNAKVVSTNPAA